MNFFSIVCKSVKQERKKGRKKGRKEERGEREGGKSAYKWTHVVQTWVVQGSTVHNTSSMLPWLQHESSLRSYIIVHSLTTEYFPPHAKVTLDWSMPNPGSHQSVSSVSHHCNEYPEDRDGCLEDHSACTSTCNCDNIHGLQWTFSPGSWRMKSQKHYNHSAQLHSSSRRAETYLPLPVFHSKHAWHLVSIFQYVFSESGNINYNHFSLSTGNEKLVQWIIFNRILVIVKYIINTWW